MKSIDQIISEIDTYKIYDEMKALVISIPKDGNISGDLASTLQNKNWLITQKVSKLLGDLEERVVILERRKEDILGDKRAISQEKSETAKDRDAKCTEEYRAVADELAVTKVAFNKVQNQKKFFDNGVYVMRSRQDYEKRDWHSTPNSEVK